MSIQQFLLLYGIANKDWKESCDKILDRAKRNKTHRQLITENENDVWLASELPLTVTQIHQFANQQNQLA